MCHANESTADFLPVQTSVSCTTDVAPIPSELSATLMGCSLSTELMAVMAHAFLPGAVALTGLPHTECEGKLRVSFMSSHVQPWGTTVVNVGPAWSSFPARPGEAREHTDSETNRNRAHGSVLH